MKTIPDVEYVTFTQNNVLPPDHGYKEGDAVTVKRAVGDYVDLLLTSVNKESGIHKGIIVHSDDPNFAHEEQISFVYNLLE